MDITEYCTSTIIPTNNDLNFVRFPSFTGYSELVLYASKTSSISSGIDELFPYFSVENLDPQCHMVILASRILDSIVVRIIDTDTIGSERLFLIQYGIIFSCELMEKAYMMFLYTDL